MNRTLKSVLMLFAVVTMIATGCTKEPINNGGNNGGGNNSGGNNGGQYPDTTTTTPSTTTGALPGLFSVSGTTKVYFSQGNLQYQPSTNTWRFAESQLDYVGNGNTNISSPYSGWLDLFGWGTGLNPTNPSTTNSHYSTYSEWGANAISNGGNTPNAWRTLTRDEWHYLINDRGTNSGMLFAKATINGVKGLIILPDDWKSYYFGLNKTNVTSADYTSNEISYSDWTSSLESHGAVFLPAAGYRKGTEVISVGYGGNYWSSSPGESTAAINLYFGSSDITMEVNGRRLGCSVRLVKVA